MTSSPETMTRPRNRRLLMFYDGVALLLIWSLVFLWHFSYLKAFSNWQLAGNLFLSIVCYYGARLLLKVYHQILRTGQLKPFALELAADLSASCVYFLLCRLLRAAGTPVSPAIIFASFYTLVCVLARIAYSYIYRAVKNSSHTYLKHLIAMLTLTDLESSEQGALLHLVLEPVTRSVSPINELQNVVDHFAIRGDVRVIEQITKGYINRTYRIETLSDTGHVHQYLLQRINTNVFPDVDALMENFKYTTDHLHGKFFLPATTRQGAVQMLRPTKDGRAYLRDESGCWRMLTFIDNVYSLDIPDSPETFYYAGRAFGCFAREMADVPTDEIKTVIPNFHNTRSRFEALEAVIVQDPKGRAAEVQREIAFVRKRAANFGTITDALESGLIPTRVCHNDCNLNNILFDRQSHKPVAIIDLDTVMPSSVLYDYGDSMRIGTNTATDDEKDLSKVSCDLSLYEKYACGYLEECGMILTCEELKLLPLSSLIITSEDGIRFLADHIGGDTYYNIFYPGQNLDRARTQLKLLEDMEKKLPQIIEILNKLYARLGLPCTLDAGEVLGKWKI